MKYAFIKNQVCNHSVVVLCRSLNVSRSGYYSWRARKPSANAVENNSLARNISGIHKETLYTYGSPRMHVELLDRGHQTSRGRVERLMKKRGLAAIQGKKNNRTEQNRNNESPVANILNRNFKAASPNKKWVSDITFIQTREGFLYLAERAGSSLAFCLIGERGQVLYRRAGSSLAFCLSAQNKT